MLLDVRTAARELSAGESTLRRWIREGRLPVIRLGRRVLVDPAALETLIRASHQPGAVGSKLARPARRHQ